MKKEELVYLAIPYTWNPNRSFKIANEVSSLLMQSGHVVFSPISHSHPIADYMDEDLRLSQEFWMKQDLTILERCDKMILVYIGGHGQKLVDESKGCQEELKFAKEKGIKVVPYILETES
jgi:nucleoside 2-deoxyribosyltransferase